MKHASPKIDQPAKPLSGVLAHSEHVKAVVAECADELSSANTAIRQALAEPGALPGIEDMLAKNVAIAGKVRAASAELSVVNRALKVEVRDWNLVDHQFAAAEEQEQASRHAAFHDLLPGLPNRALFNDRLEHGFAQARRRTRILPQTSIGGLCAALCCVVGDGSLQPLFQRRDAKTP